MQFQTLLVSVFAAVAAAQTQSSRASTSRTQTTTSAASTSTNLVSIVNQLPRCALSCLNTAAANINCNPGNFSCLCNNSANLISNIGLCVIAACSSDDVEKLTTLTTEICNIVSSNPDPTQVASASNIVASAIASGASATSKSSSGFAARKTDAPALAIMGGAAAAWAAYAM